MKSIERRIIQGYRSQEGGVCVCLLLNLVSAMTTTLMEAEPHK